MSKFKPSLSSRHLDFVTGLLTSGLYYKESGHPDYVTSVPKCAVQMKLLPAEGDDVVVKKTIAIFAYKQRLLSIEMKTKLVQHVESD